jgi:hypothetical protein
MLVAERGVEAESATDPAEYTATGLLMGRVQAIARRVMASVVSGGALGRGIGVSG